MSALRSPSDQPPSGPIRTVGVASMSGPPPRSATAAFGERCDRGEGLQRGDLGKPAPPALHRGLTGDPAQSRGVRDRPVGVPPHDRSFGDERHDRVHAELRELLHDELGPLSLDQRERHGDRGHRTRHLHDRTDRFGRSRSEPAPAPRALSVADRQLVAGSNAQHPGQVMANRPDRAADGRGPQRTRAVRHPSPVPRPTDRQPARRYLKAERIFDRKPVSAGATSS